MKKLGFLLSFLAIIPMALTSCSGFNDINKDKVINHLKENGEGPYDEVYTNSEYTTMLGYDDGLFFVSYNSVLDYTSYTFTSAFEYGDSIIGGLFRHKAFGTTEYDVDVALSIKDHGLCEFEIVKVNVSPTHSEDTKVLNEIMKGAAELAINNASRHLYQKDLPYIY